MIKNCDYCGEEFNQSKRQKRFCCFDCYKKYKSENKIGKKIKYDFLETNTKNSKIYNVWCGMFRRCYNKNNKSFSQYGGREIIICNEWKDFKIFYEWAINNGYKEGLSIERIDVNGNYCPSNCTWISIKEQAKNRQNTIKVFYKNEFVTLIDISEKENINYKDLWANYKKYIEINKAIEICKLHNNNLIITNKSGHRGVYFYKNRWVAYFNQKYIGRFKTFDDAVKARLKAEQDKKKAS